MRLLPRLLAVFVLLLSTIAFVCCVAGVVGIWMFRGDASRNADNLAAHVDTGLQRTSAATHSIRRSLNTVRDDVILVEDLPDDSEARETKIRLCSEFLRTVIQRLKNFSEAAATVSFLLQSYQELPLGKSSRINPDKLKRAAEQATQLSAEVQKLQATVGEADKQLTDKELVTIAHEMDLVLLSCMETVDDWQAELEASRTELPELKSRILPWLTIAAVAVTIVCVWIGLSQISLFAHAWKWCKSA